MTASSTDTAATGLTRRKIAALVAMIASAGAVGTGLSLGLPLLALVLEARGVSGTWIGINTAMAGIAALIVTPFVTPLAIRVGPLALLIASLLITSVSLIGFHLATEFWIWFPLRLVFHGALGTAFVLSEFWIASLAPDARRGFVMGIYATVLSAGFAVGPILLGTVGSTGLLPFAIGSAILSAAVIPALLARGATPELHGAAGQRSAWSFVFAVPLATFASLVFGAVESGAMAILPVYGLRLGMPERDAALLVTVAALGNVAMQIPLGLLADKVDKRRLLVGCAFVGVCGTLLMPIASVSYPWLLCLVFVWGGVTAGLYTIGLTLLGASYTGANLAAANAAFVMLYATGMMVGPPAIGFGLDLAPPHGATNIMAGFFALYLAIGVFSLARSRFSPARDRA